MADDTTTAAADLVELARILSRGTRELPDELKLLAVDLVCTCALFVVLKTRLPRLPLKLCVSGANLAGSVAAKMMAGHPGFLIGGAGAVVLIYIFDVLLDVVPKRTDCGGYDDMP